MWRHNTKLASVGPEAIAWACTSTAPWKLSGYGLVIPVRSALPFCVNRPTFPNTDTGRSLCRPITRLNLPSVKTGTPRNCCQSDRRCVAFLRILLMTSVSAVQIKRWGTLPTPALERPPSQLGLLGIARHCTFERTLLVP